jgi:hypothetical protein
MRAPFLALALIPLASVAHAQCTPQWDTSLASQAIDGSIYCSAFFDDGNGPALFVGGYFQSIGGTAAHSIAKTYDGVHWLKVGDAFFIDNFYVGAHINDMVPFDPDGAGPLPAVLVVAGTFSHANNNATEVNNVAVWNGTAWSALGNGPANPPQPAYEVKSLEVFDSGSGPRLYAGGYFAVSGNLKNIAMWDGSAWQAVGSTGTSDDFPVYDMTVHNDGTGPALYIAGRFGGIIGVPNSAQLARWNGTAWSGVGPTGVPQGGPLQLHANVVSFDADGPGGAPAKLLAFENNERRLDTWNGATWTSTTLPGVRLGGGEVPIVEFNDGTGPALYFPAGYIDPNLFGRSYLTRYNGETYSQLGDDLLYLDGSISISHLAVNPLTTPASLLVAAAPGTTTVPAEGLLSFDFATSNYAPFAPVGGAVRNLFTNGYNYGYLYRGLVQDIVTADLDGAGPQPESTIAFGEFSAIGGVAADAIAAHDGSTWSGVGRVGIPAGLTLGRIHAVPSPTGNELMLSTYTAAEFPGTPGGGVFRYNAGTWSPLGSAAVFTTTAGTSGFVDHLVAANVGAGNETFAFGTFDFVGGAPAQGFAKWNGSAWSAVGGGGIFGASGPKSAVAFNDGSGPAIFISGVLLRVGTSADFVTGVFKWNGASWTSINAGLSIGAGSVPTLALFNGELWGWLHDQRDLYRWNGTTWAVQTTAPVGSQLVGVADTGDGDRFYYTSFDPALNAWSMTILDFDGTTWTQHPEMGRLTMNFPTKVLGTNANGGHALWFHSLYGSFGVGGESNPSTVNTINALQSSDLARWYCAAPPCPADLDNGSGTGTPDGGVDINDLLFFLVQFEAGANAADLDNGSGTGTPDGGVDINDLLFFLVHFEAGC